MSLATYADLQTAVGNWLARSGDPVVTSNVADWITLCEARMAYGSGYKQDPDATFWTEPLRIRAMERSYTTPIQAVTAIPVGSVGGSANAITLTPQTAIASYKAGQTWNFAATASISGAVTVNISGLGSRSVLKGSALSALATGDIVNGQNVQLYDDGTELILMPGSANAPLPPAYLSMRNVYLDTNPRIILNPITPANANIGVDSQWPDDPAWYAIEADALRLEPPPFTSYDLVTLYWQKFGALSTATNWMMTNKPDVYLYGTLLEASIFLGDDAGALKYLKLYRGACNGLQSQDSVDRFSGGPLTIRNDSGNP